jgi:hypothetical protein
MKKGLICLAAAALLAGCHSRAGTLQRKDQGQYDVVQEGQASGVTSTINAPGETTPPPMTATNADTTSNFTIPQVSATSTAPAQPGTIAGTLPQNAGGTTMPGYPRDTPPRPKPRPTPRTDTTSTSVEGTPPPPASSTLPPTVDTAPPPPPEKSKTETTAPPPTTTT